MKPPTTTPAPVTTPQNVPAPTEAKIVAPEVSGAAEAGEAIWPKAVAKAPSMWDKVKNPAWWAAQKAGFDGANRTGHFGRWSGVAPSGVIPAGLALLELNNARNNLNAGNPVSALTDTIAAVPAVSMTTPNILPLQWLRGAASGADAYWQGPESRDAYAEGARANFGDDSSWYGRAARGILDPTQAGVALTTQAFGKLPEAQSEARDSQSATNNQSMLTGIRQKYVGATLDNYRKQYNQATATPEEVAPIPGGPQNLAPADNYARNKFNAAEDARVTPQIEAKRQATEAERADSYRKYDEEKARLDKAPNKQYEDYQNSLKKQSALKKLGVFRRASGILDENSQDWCNTADLQHLKSFVKYAFLDETSYAALPVDPTGPKSLNEFKKIAGRTVSKADLLKRGLKID